jgi:hypothetical protein
MRYLTVEGNVAPMNRRQKSVLLAAIIVIALMLLFPPFQFRASNGAIANLGYGFLFDPPITAYASGSVNQAMLITQWLAVLLAGGLGYLICKDQK